MESYVCVSVSGRAGNRVASLHHTMTIRNERKWTRYEAGSARSCSSRPGRNSLLRSNDAFSELWRGRVTQTANMHMTSQHHSLGPDLSVKYC